MKAVKWVLTVKTDDGVTAHVESQSKEDLEGLLVDIEKEFGPIGDRGSIEERAATWECSGVDGCLVS